MGTIRHRGLTLLEVVVAVAIIAVLACTVILQFSNYVTTTREAALQQNLVTIREQLQVYRNMHKSGYPDAGSFIEQMTKYTDAMGNVADSRSDRHGLGPYLQRMPVNSFTNSAAVTVIDDPQVAFAPPAANGGWWFNRATGEFRAELSDEVKGRYGQPVWLW